MMHEGYAPFDPRLGLQPGTGQYCRIALKNGYMTWAWYDGNRFELDPLGEQTVPNEEVTHYQEVDFRYLENEAIKQ
jgi:hypothetical protein